MEKESINGNIIPDNIVVLVFTSALNLHERALSVQNTWLKDFPNGYLIGGYFYDPSLKMISLGKDVGEDYLSATYKQFLGLKVMYERFPNSEWFFVTGCDAYVYSKNLCALLSKYDSQKDYYIGGHFGKRNVNNTDITFAFGGPGFALSASLLKKLLPHIDFILKDYTNYEIMKNGACDVTIAYYLLKLFGIEPTFEEGFYHCQPYKYPGVQYYNGNNELITQSPIDNPIAFHNLSIREMYLLRKEGRKEGALKPKTPITFLFDKVCAFISKKLKTKRFVNTVCKFLFG